MQTDAEMNAEADRKQYELATARNEGETMCYQMEKMMSEHKDKLQDSDKAPLEAAIKKVRETAQGDDTDAIKSAVKELEQASHALSKAMYDSADAGAGSDPSSAPEPAAEAAAEDDAIDAEFEVKD